MIRASLSGMRLLSSSRSRRRRLVASRPRVPHGERFGLERTDERRLVELVVVGQRTIAVWVVGPHLRKSLLRIPSADELIVEWPQEAFAQVRPDHQTAIVVLTHDDKFDEPALIGALETEAFYIGALGSRRNQERRRERLLEAGVLGGQARADHGAVRPRRRRRHAGGDGAVDPRGDPRRSG